MTTIRIRHIFAIFFWLIPFNLFAFDISSFGDIPVTGDVLLSPAKVEISMDRGATRTSFIDILNRTGNDQVFKIEVEDFSTENYSLKNYITVPTGEFLLTQGQQAHIPVTINIPRDVSPGGLYGAVLVSSRPLKNISGATNIVTRIGSLFFVSVMGEVHRSGNFKSFDFSENKLVITFENDGDIYLNPYGIISIYEYSSRKLIKKIDVDPWFVLPQSTKSRSIAIDGLASGKYAAEIMLNKGYDNLVDNKYVNFEISGDSVISPKNVGSILFFIALLIFFFYVKF